MARVRWSVEGDGCAEGNAKSSRRVRVRVTTKGGLQKAHDDDALMGVGLVRCKFVYSQEVPAPLSACSLSFHEITHLIERFASAPPSRTTAPLG